MNHIWKGAAPNFTKIANLNNNLILSLIVLIESKIIRRITPETRAWTIKYFTLACDWNLQLLKFKKEIKVKRLISMKNHINKIELVFKQKNTLTKLIIRVSIFDIQEI